MEGRTYYQRAMLLPIVLTAISGSVMLAGDRWPSALPHALVDTAEWVTPLLLMALVPYGVVVLALPRIAKPRRTVHYRLLALGTPIVAGTLLGVIVAVSGALSKGVHAEQLAFIFLGAWCGALVGFPIVILVELGFLLGRALGWIPRETGPDVQVG